MTQVYQETVPQLKSSVMEALADLGYTGVTCEEDAGIITIRATTVDHRPARITISPRNTMSSMTVKIGHVGDEMVSQALIQRVAMNFGELPRTVIPMEPTLQRRADPLRPRRPIPPGGTVVTPEVAVPLSPEPPDLPPLPGRVGPFIALRIESPALLID